MKIYFTRHGETLWNLEHRFQGWKDSELTEIGVKRAEFLGKRLEHVKIDKIFTSPIKRAKRTAEIIRGNREIEVVEVEGLKEISFGKWEGMSTEEIKACEEYVDELENLFNKPYSYTSFEGENIKEFTERLFKTVEDIIRENKDKDILLVSHGMCVRYLTAYFKNELEEKQIVNCPIFNQASYNEVEWDGEKFEVIELNNIDHYEYDNNIKMI